MTLLNLALLGMVGGAFLIPFDSFIQVNSPDEKRGQVIAATSFFSFLGVLAAAFALYFINEELGFSAASGFLVMGVLTFFVTVIITGRLSSFFFPFFAKKILKRFRKLVVTSSIPDSSTIVILHSNSWWDAILFFSCLSDLKILLPSPFLRHFPWFNGFTESIQIAPNNLANGKMRAKVIERVKKLQENNNTVCFFFHRRFTSEKIIGAYQQTLEQMRFTIVHAHGKKEKISKNFLGFHWHLKQIEIHFSKE